MSRSLCFLCLAAIALCWSAGCRNDVVVHPPTAENRYVSVFPPPLESYLAMDQPAAVRNIVSGVSNDVVDGGRWTEHKVVLQFHCIPLDELRFHAAFELPEKLMARAEQILLRIAVEGKMVHQAEYFTAGPQEIEKRMPPGSLTFERETEVTLEMTVPSGRVPAGEIGYLLTSAGFRY